MKFTQLNIGKHWKGLVIGFFLIGVMGFSTYTLACDPNRELFALRRTEEANLSEQLRLAQNKAEELRKNPYEGALSELNPEEISFSEEDLAALNDGLLERIYDEWVNEPKYSYSEETQGNWHITTLQTPERCITTRELEVDGQKIIHTSEHRGRPILRPIQSESSLLPEITVPIIPEVAGIGSAYEPEYHKINHTVLFGYEMDEPISDTDTYDYRGIWVGRTLKVTRTLFVRLVFPVTFILEFPKEVMENHDYEYRCTAVPINKDNFNEYERTFTIRYQYERYHAENVLEPYESTCHFLIWSWPCTKHRLVKKWFYDDTPIDYNRPFTKTASYKAPLGDRGVTIPAFKLDLNELLKDIDILNWIHDIVDVSFKLDIEIYAGSISALMNLFPQIGTYRIPTWFNEKTEVLDFTAKGTFSNVKFQLNLPTYVLSNVVLQPCLEISFKGIFAWLGSHTYSFDFDIPCPFPIIKSNNYESSSVDIIEDLTGVYDFTVDIQKLTSGQDPRAILVCQEVKGETTNSPPSYLYKDAQQYAITLRNSNLESDQSDTISLEVLGLPEDCTATFDKINGKYDLHGDTSDPIGEYLGPMGASTAEVTAVLTIYIPRHIKAPPGDFTFTISATSAQKEYWGFPGAEITESAILDVPVTYGIDFNLDPTLYHGMEIFQGEFIEIGFSGHNYGNENDTIKVSATLWTDDYNKTWNQDFTVDRYGLVQDSYQDAFAFTFERSDIIPSPGIYEFSIQANSSRTPYIDEEDTLFIVFTKAYGIEASITPAQTTVFANWETNFTVKFNNTGNFWDNFTIESSGWDIYLTYPTRLENVVPMFTEEFIVTLRIPDPDILTPDTYNFRITIKSETAGNIGFAVCEASLNILEPDKVPPSVIRDDIFPHASIPLVFPQSPLSLGPSWKGFDEYPNTYAVYINDSLVESNNWVSDTPVHVPVTGSRPLDEGLYNITITFSDTSGNVGKDEVWVTIMPPDTNSPILTPIPKNTTFPVNFVQPQCFGWNCTEENLLNVTLYRNGTIIPVTDTCFETYEDESDKWLTRYLIEPSTLSEGTWNYTLVLQDMSNNIEKSTIMVTITPPDTSSPELIGLPFSSAYIGHGEVMTVTATDSFPSRYELWYETQLIGNDTWITDTPFIFSVDELGIPVGTYNLDLYIYDLANNYNLYQWSFDYVDIDTPTLLAPIDDFTIYEHNFTMSISPEWIFHDLDTQPGTYSIQLNSVVISEGIWLPGNGSIQVPAYGLQPGIHHFDAYFSDASGNTLYTSVDVTVKDVIAPYIWPMRDILFEPLFVANWFELSILEKHPASFSLYRNNTLVATGPLTADFPMVFEQIDDYTPGTYNYSLEVLDESNNIGRTSLLVYVSDFTPPFINRPPDLVISEDAIGQTIIWGIREANPHNYSLYLDGVLIDSGTSLGDVFSYSLSNLGIGDHTFTLVVYDQFGLSHTCISYVTVQDMTPPSISAIADCRFVEADSNAFIEWKVYDRHPSHYIISVDNTILPQINWDGSNIVLQCVGWSPGSYTVDLKVFDLSGNFKIDEVNIEIVAEESVHNVPSISPSFGLIWTLLVISVLIGFKRRKQIKKNQH